MCECICVGSIDNKPLLLDTDALLQTLAVTTAGLSYCYLSTASNKSPILTSDISAASSSSSLDVVSVFSAKPRDGSDAVGIPAAQWQFAKHRKTSDPSPTPNSRVRHVQSHFESSFFPPLEALNFSEVSSPRPHDQMH